MLACQDTNWVDAITLIFLVNFLYRRCSPFFLSEYPLSSLFSSSSIFLSLSFMYSMSSFFYVQQDHVKRITNKLFSQFIDCNSIFITELPASTRRTTKQLFYFHYYIVIRETLDKTGKTPIKFESILILLALKVVCHICSQFLNIMKFGMDQRYTLAIPCMKSYSHIQVS